MPKQHTQYMLSHCVCFCSKLLDTIASIALPKDQLPAPTEPVRQSRHCNLSRATPHGTRINGEIAFGRKRLGLQSFFARHCWTHWKPIAAAGTKGSNWGLLGPLKHIGTMFHQSCHKTLKTDKSRQKRPCHLQLYHRLFVDSRSHTLHLRCGRILQFNSSDATHGFHQDTQCSHLSFDLFFA